MDKAGIAAGLSFVTMNDGLITYWTPAATSDYAGQCKVGRARAEEAIAFAREHDEPLILLRIMQAIARTQPLAVSGGAEIAFFQRVAEEAVSSPG